MSPRRLALTPGQLQRLLDVLSSFGFVPKRVEVSPQGGLTLHASVAEQSVEPDLLQQWEAKRGLRSN